MPARKFLYQFHDESFVQQAQQELAVGQVSNVPKESVQLRGLAQVNHDLVAQLAQRCREHKISTIDLDATVIESWKREAQPTYQGTRGYQPVLALWAEMDRVVADQFRDGNVGAHCELLEVAQRGLAALPETVEERYFRGDSACDDQQSLKWLRTRNLEGGPEGYIGFAVSVRMNDWIKEKLRMLPDAGWVSYREDAGVA